MLITASHEVVPPPALSPMPFCVVLDGTVLVALSCLSLTNSSNPTCTRNQKNVKAASSTSCQLVAHSSHWSILLSSNAFYIFLRFLVLAVNRNPESISKSPFVEASFPHICLMLPGISCQLWLCISTYSNDFQPKVCQ